MHKNTGKSLSVYFFVFVFRNVIASTSRIRDNVLKELRQKSEKMLSHQRFLIISMDEIKSMIS